MGMNSMVGVCQQQKNNATPTITTNMNSVTISSLYKGADSSSGSIIPVQERISTTVNQGANVPADGVAFQYSATDAVSIKNAIQINYDTSGLTDNDLPPDGECKIKITYTNTQGTSDNPISGWNYNLGVYYPASANEAYVVIGDLNRSAVNAGNSTTTPIIGFSQLEIQESSPITQNAPSSLEELTFQTAPPNRTGTVGFGVQVLLANGTYTQIDSRSITFVGGSIKQYLVGKRTRMNNVTITSAFKGDTNNTGQPIDPSQALTTVVNSGATVPANGVAYQFSTTDPQTIQNSVVINYDTRDISDSDLPADGSCELKITITNLQGGPNNPISGWNYEIGSYYPQKASLATFEIRGLNRSQVNAGDSTNTPPIGIANIEIANADPPENSPGNLNRLTWRTSAPNRVGDVGFSVQVLLDDGTYTEITPTDDRITFASGSIKPTLIDLETFSLQSITITPKKSIPSEQFIFPQVALPQGTEIPVTLNSGNSFTIADNSLYYEDTRTVDPNTGAFDRVGHSFVVTFDTSTLTASNFPEFGVIAQIVVTSPGYPEEFTWRYDGGDELQTFEWETEERGQIITGGVVTPPIEYPDETDAPFLAGLDINGLNNLTAKVRIQLSSGLFVESNEVTITVAPLGVRNLIE